MSFDGTGEPGLGDWQKTNWSEWDTGGRHRFAAKRIARNVSQQGIGAREPAATGL
jgi:hypothetical protein